MDSTTIGADQNEGRALMIATEDNNHNASWIIGDRPKVRDRELILLILRSFHPSIWNGTGMVKFEEL